MNYDLIKDLFNGSLSPSQQSGIETIISEAGEEIDKRHLAYILATVFHETGRKMQPIEEAGYLSKDKQLAYLTKKEYYPYYGRDLVHTTWKANYQKVKDFCEVDCINNPELIGQMPLAAKVAITFMLKGCYTGKKLADYFNSEKSDSVNARRIINSLDKANLISSYYERFLEALK